MAAQANYQQAALAASIRQGQRNGALLQLGPYSTTPSAQNEGSLSITNTGSTAIQFVQVIYVYHETDNTGVTDDGVLNQVVATFNAGSGSCVTAPASTLGIGGQCDYTASVTLPNSGPYATADNCGTGTGLNMTCHAQRPAIGVVTFLGNVYWYNYTAWAAGQATGTGTSISFTSTTSISSSSSTTCEAYCLYTVTFTESGLPTGSQWAVTFDSITAYAPAPDAIIFVNVPTGTYFWVAGSPVAGPAGYQYVASPGYGNMVVSSTGSNSQSIVYSPQYLLTMTSSPSAGGTVTPSTGWFNPGTVVGISETPNADYIWGDWVGTGSGHYSGTATSTTVQMNAPITETATFTPFTRYTIAFSEAGLPSGTTWSITGVNSTVTSGPSPSSTTSSIKFIDMVAGTYVWSAASPIAGATGVQYVTSAGGTITLPDTGTPTGCSNFNAGTETCTISQITYTTQYFLTLQVASGQSSYGTVPAGGWYNSGSTPSVTATPYPGYSFASWTGSTTAPGVAYTGTSNPTPTYTTRSPTGILMDNPVTETASFTVNQRYTVDFVESGLPSGTWGVSYNGTHTSTTTTISLLNSVTCSGGCSWSIPTAYLAITVGGVTYVATPSSGSIALPATGNLPGTGTGCSSVSGTTCTVNITYEKAFTVIFAESGLPSSASKVCGGNGNVECEWNATLGSMASSTTASNTITFSDVVPGSYAWDIVTHPNTGTTGCNFDVSCNIGNFTAQTSSGMQYQYNTEVLNAGVYTYDNNSASSPLVIPTSGTPANNPAQGLSCTGTTCTISLDFVAQYELNACALPAGTGGFGGEGGSCNDAVPPNNPGGYIQLSVVSGSGPQPTGYTVTNNLNSGVFNGAVGLFFNAGTGLKLTSIPLAGDVSTTWTSDPQATGDGCSTPDSGSSGSITFTMGTTCISEAMTFSEPTFSISCSPGSGGSCLSESHTTTVAITLTGSGFPASTTYSYCLSSSPTSTLSCVFGSGDQFTTSSGGSIPSGTIMSVTGGSVPKGTYYLIVYSERQSLPTHR